MSEDIQKKLNEVNDKIIEAQNEQLVLYKKIIELSKKEIIKLKDNYLK